MRGWHLGLYGRPPQGQDIKLETNGSKESNVDEGTLPRPGKQVKHGITNV